MQLSFFLQLLPVVPLVVSALPIVPALSASKEVGTVQNSAAPAQSDQKPTQPQEGALKCNSGQLASLSKRGNSKNAQFINHCDICGETDIAIEPLRKKYLSSGGYHECDRGHGGCADCVDGYKHSIYEGYCPFCEADDRGAQIGQTIQGNPVTDEEILETTPLGSHADSSAYAPGTSAAQPPNPDTGRSGQSQRPPPSQQDTGTRSNGSGKSSQEQATTDSRSKPPLASKNNDQKPKQKPAAAQANPGPSNGASTANDAGRPVGDRERERTPYRFVPGSNKDTAPQSDSSEQPTSDPERTAQRKTEPSSEKVVPPASDEPVKPQQDPGTSAATNNLGQQTQDRQRTPYSFVPPSRKGKQSQSDASKDASSETERPPTAQQQSVQEDPNLQRGSTRKTAPEPQKPAKVQQDSSTSDTKDPELPPEFRSRQQRQYGGVPYSQPKTDAQNIPLRQKGTSSNSAPAEQQHQQGSAGNAVPAPQAPGKGQEDSSTSDTKGVELPPEFRSRQQRQYGGVPDSQKETGAQNIPLRQKGASSNSASAEQEERGAPQDRSTTQAPDAGSASGPNSNADTTRPPAQTDPRTAGEREKTTYPSLNRQAAKEDPRSSADRDSRQPPPQQAQPESSRPGAAADDRDQPQSEPSRSQPATSRYDQDQTRPEAPKSRPAPSGLDHQDSRPPISSWRYTRHTTYTRYEIVDPLPASSGRRPSTSAQKRPYVRVNSDGKMEAVRSSRKGATKDQAASSRAPLGRSQSTRQSATTAQRQRSMADASDAEAEPEQRPRRGRRKSTAATEQDGSGRRYDEQPRRSNTDRSGAPNSQSRAPLSTGDKWRLAFGLQTSRKY